MPPWQEYPLSQAVPVTVLDLVAVPEQVPPQDSATLLVRVAVWVKGVPHLLVD